MPFQADLSPIDRHRRHTKKTRAHRCFPGGTRALLLGFELDPGMRSIAKRFFR
ncbi:hypothetical protein LptCag_1901 [Leptospirillum ferriphilum]|uniref:Uncharacterized protein n=1 Tax=Leptospirillum ferriphilum TaxID=178606 RepID=A0A094YJ24_9BACT|nr:hypothetical protein LptCag_1901 [Leptospirillum ferriphilum]